MMIYAAKIVTIVMAVFFALTTTVSGFGIPTTRHIPTTKLKGHDTSVTTTESNHPHHHQISFWQRMIWNPVLSGMVIAGTIWSSPASLVPLVQDHYPTLAVHGMAQAKEKASGSGSRVNKDPESLLRYGLPIQNKEVRVLQATIENIQTDIGSKRKSAALEGVQKSRYLLSPKGSIALTSSCRDAKICEGYIQQMTTTLSPLESSLQESRDDMVGSEQERAALDRAYVEQRKLTKILTSLEEQMIPAGYVTPVPSDYDDLPQLQGRATVEMSFRKESGAPFNVQGVNYPTAKLVMVIDGYVAPITGGNFIDLVQKGFYNNMKIQRSDGFVVQTGDPDGDAVGYVGTPGKALGAGKQGERLIPLELTLRGDPAPIYESTLDEYGRGGEATVLPFSAYGAMGWAREEYDANSGSSQFFWLLFDSDLTPAGKNLLDGNYPCFGYTVEGADLLADIKEGDIITSSKVTSGLEHLKLPSSK